MEVWLVFECIYILHDKSVMCDLVWCVNLVVQCWGSIWYYPTCTNAVCVCVNVQCSAGKDDCSPARCERYMLGKYRHGIRFNIKALFHGERCKPFSIFCLFLSLSVSPTPYLSTFYNTFISFLVLRCSARLQFNLRCQMFSERTCSKCIQREEERDRER